MFRVEIIYISSPNSLLNKRSPRGSCNSFLGLVKSFFRLVYFPQSLQFVLINKLVGSYSYVTYVGTLLAPSIDGKQIISKEDEDNFTDTMWDSVACPVFR